MRFFSAQLAARSSSKLNVDMIYPALGTSKPKAETLSGTSSVDALQGRQAAPRAGLQDQRLALHADPLQRRTAAATGDWRVDDVLVDPRMRG